MWTVSAFGDTALLAPASLLLLGYLAAWKRWRMAAAFGLALAFTGLATLAAKLLFRACGPSLDLDVVSPSGHASFATLFYGVLAILLAAKASPAGRVGVIATTALVLAAIGASRVAVGVHSSLEVFIGFGIGAVGLAIFARFRGSAAGPALWPFILAGGVAAAFVVLTGKHFNLEHQIARAAGKLAHLDMCLDDPERRAELRELPLRR